MTQDTDNPRCYKADEGKQFQRVADNQIFGTEITLGENDYISNYIEVDDPYWSDTETEMEKVALLKYINAKKSSSYTELGDAIIDLVSNN